MSHMNNFFIFCVVAFVYCFIPEPKGYISIESFINWEVKCGHKGKNFFPDENFCSISVSP